MWTNYLLTLHDERNEEIKTTSQFKKDLKIAVKRNCDIEELKTVVKKLANGETLEEKYHDNPFIC